MWSAAISSLRFGVTQTTSFYKCYFVKDPDKVLINVAIMYIALIVRLAVCLHRKLALTNCFPDNVFQNLKK